jgi:DNA polymerase
MKANERTENFAEQLYKEIADKKIYITNLAKCTQADARPLKDKVFKDYLTYTMEEIALLQPKHIISLGNQVSSILLHKPIRVSEYKNNDHETLTIDNTTYKVYPTFYPVGQGMRNMPLAIERIQKIKKPTSL